MLNIDLKMSIDSINTLYNYAKEHNLKGQDCIYLNVHHTQNVSISDVTPIGISKTPRVIRKKK